MAHLPLHDRREAGMMLAAHLAELRGRDDLIVLGLPRGGIPVAYEVARALEAPLDAYIVRKLGVPGHEELAMGAIATGDVTILNDDTIAELGIGQGAIDAVIAQETRELHRRERLYRGTKPPPAVAGRTVILVDDGLATGTTMRAAVRAARQLRPRSIIVAVPVAAPSVCRSFEGEVDRIVCGATPEPFYALGMWYEDFAQTTDQEVRDLLARASEPADPPPPRHGSRMPAARSPLQEAITRQATPLTGERDDYDLLLGAIGDARLVLIGEASHGTEEFYQRRADLTRA